MKTATEIVQYLEADKRDYGFETDTLLEYLDFDLAKPFLIDAAKAEEWKTSALTPETVIEEMREYMEFAIDKAENHRGLFARRSITRFRAWLWLLGDDELTEFADADGNYKNYGAPILLKICQKYGFNFSMSQAFLNMADGNQCRHGCDEGCAR